MMQLSIRDSIDNPKISTIDLFVALEDAGIVTKKMDMTEGKRNLIKRLSLPAEQMDRVLQFD